MHRHVTDTGEEQCEFGGSGILQQQQQRVHLIH